MNKMGKAGILVKKLAESESITNHSQVIGFNEGPKKNDKIITLHFENGSSQEYTKAELFQVNGINTASIPFGASPRILKPSPWKTLVGKAFHIKIDGKIHYQGVIQAEPYPQIFVISYFSWLDACSTGERLISLATILENNGIEHWNNEVGSGDGWFFYESLEDMNEAYAFENNVDVSQVTMGHMTSV